MAGLRISERYKCITVPQAAERLGISPAKLRHRSRDAILPPPTYVNEHGLKFFDEAWLKNSFENRPEVLSEGRKHDK
jgi:hypothetical protein